ncbi:MAG: hypothetical protein MUC85_01195 [Anaerolineales bacterium]|jgi:hypothetical protein|nr:hypothetical protein [Anaerolineales bacterium]
MQNLKNEPKTMYLVILIALLFTLCLCVCLFAVLGLGFFWIKDADLDFSSPSVQPQDINQQMDLIQQQAAQLRGLSPTYEITRTLINTDQLRQNVTTDFLSEYSTEEAREDALILSAFGLLESDYDLFNLYLELYTEQIAGYYDHETKEMFVVQESGFQGPERLTYAHEFAHVLQDQTYDIQNGLQYDDDTCEEDSERCLGIQALLEGDASLLELQWFKEYATNTDRSQILDSSADSQSPVYDSAPAFLKEDFLFPYTSGYAFVEYLYKHGGWDAVNQAYAVVPVSSEQILHPESYPLEIPLNVTLPDFTPVLGTGWQEMDRGVMGEWYTFLILAYGSDPNSRVEIEQAQSAAAGWGGDAYTVYLNPGDNSLLMLLVTEWDAHQEAQEFEQVFLAYLNNRFGQPDDGVWHTPGAWHRFERQGTRTIWIMAPSISLVNGLWNLIASP